MAIGEKNTPHPSPIVNAITAVERQTSGEIRVHLSRHWWERDALNRAQKIFRRFSHSKIESSEHQNAVLLYVNLRRRKLAVLGGKGMHARVGQDFWDRIMKELRQDLRCTHYENAISAAVLKIGSELARHFPAKADPPNESGRMDPKKCF